MLSIRYLVPTHNTIRDPKSVRLIVDFLKEGRIFRCQEKPICLTQFSDDGTMYIRDGHRRLCAALIAGADLLDCEYKIENMSYQDYMTANPDKGWYTPFNPIIECRLPDFFDFKDSLKTIWEIPNYLSDNSVYKQEVLDKIKNQSHLYKEPRRIFSLKELVESNFHNGCN